MQEINNEAINKENLLITKNDNVNWKRNSCHNKVFQQKTLKKNKSLDKFIKTTLQKKNW